MIRSKTLDDCFRVLRKSHYFQTDSLLHTLFTDELELYRYSLPITNNDGVQGRVEKITRFLTNKHTIDGNSALVLFLKKLSAHYPDDDAMKSNLLELTRRVQTDMNERLRSSFSIFGPPKKKYTYDLFVLMPFIPNLKPVYDDHIKKIAIDLNLSIARADDFFSQDSIMDEIWSAITQASVLIADCTGKNPNVFYEIGLAHAIGKPVILITQNSDDVPFDLRHRRYILYAYTPPGMKNFEKALSTTVLEIRKDFVTLS